MFLFSPFLFPCAVMQHNTPLITATVDGVTRWCPFLSTGHLSEAFWHLCKQLAFSIIPDQKDASMARLWFSCWSNLLCLNGSLPSDATVIHFSFAAMFIDRFSHQTYLSLGLALNVPWMPGPSS